MSDTEKLRDFLAKIAFEQRYDKPEIALKQLSNDGSSYTTHLYLAAVSAPGKSDLHLFIKEAILRDYFLYLFRNERRFYSEIARVYDSIQDKHNVRGEDRLIFPRYFGCKHSPSEDALVLEDLTASGFVLADRLKPLDWEFAAKVTDELAKFHALWFAYAEENPEESQKLLDDMKFEIPTDVDHETLMAKSNDNMRMSVKPEFRETVEKFLQEWGSLEKVTHFYKPLVRPVLTHGDFKFSNLMHRVRENGKLEVAIIDYQTIRTCSTVADLIMFVFLSSDQEFRRRYFRRLVDHYYSRLSCALRRLSLDPERVYSKALFDREMETIKPFAMVTALHLLPIALVQSQDAPDVDSMSLTDFAVKSSELFAERLNGIVEDLIEWGWL